MVFTILYYFWAILSFLLPLMCWACLIILVFVYKRKQYFTINNDIFIDRKLMLRSMNRLSWSLLKVLRVCGLICSTTNQIICTWTKLRRFRWLWNSLVMLCCCSRKTLRGCWVLQHNREESKWWKPIGNQRGANTKYKAQQISS